MILTERIIKSIKNIGFGPYKGINSDAQSVKQISNCNLITNLMDDHQLNKNRSGERTSQFADRDPQADLIVLKNLARVINNPVALA